MSTAVELQGGLETDDALDVSGRLELAEALLGRVEAVDIGLVVLGVVEGHDLRRDGRLERLGLVGNQGKDGVGRGGGSGRWERNASASTGPRRLTS
mgnify:CR=1 FL=1